MKHSILKDKIESQEVSNLDYEPVSCASSRERKRCYVACSDMVIRSYELDSFEFREVVGKMTQPIHFLAISADSRYLYIIFLTLSNT